MRRQISGNGLLSTFGEGIAETFMFPYNSKVWTTPLERMSKGWIAERVSVVDFKRLLENVLYEKDDVAWGPNNKFRFPLHGGTGEIYRRMAKRFPDKVRTGKQLAEVDTGAAQDFVCRRHRRQLRRADLHRAARFTGGHVEARRRETTRGRGVART